MRRKNEKIVDKTNNKLYNDDTEKTKDEVASLYCKNCGAQIDGNALFCPSCGKSNDANTALAQPVENSQKPDWLTCLQCGSSALQLVTETEVTGGGGGGYSAGKGCLGGLLMGPAGLLCGACGSKGKPVQSTNKNYWLCSQCGNKFRNPKEEYKEVIAAERNSWAILTLGIIFVILGIVLTALFIWVDSTFFTGIGCASIACGGLCILLYFSCKSMFAKRKKQLIEKYPYPGFFDTE